MSSEAQRVLVIQDASREISSSAVNWAIDALSLRPGDELTLLGVLHQVNIPSMFRYMGAAKLIGCNSSVAANPKLHAKQKTTQEDVEGRENEYQDSAEISPISELCEAKRIVFHRQVVQASSPKLAAVEAAEKLKATWVILDRGMTRDKRYLMERLSCGISKVNRNNSVELLRGPKTVETGTGSTELSPKSKIISNEVSTGSEKRTIKVTLSPLDDEDLFSLELSPSNNERSTKVDPDGSQIDLQIGRNSTVEEPKMEEAVENLACKQCGNVRPKVKMKRAYTCSELHAATNGFSAENFLSEGGFGAVYRGKLEDGNLIAVKQYKAASLQGENEFRAEVEVLSKATHKNVVMLLGSCSEGSKKLLVYEYVCNGSLDVHLSKHSPEVLRWEHRMNIALGAARGLNYLHQNNIIHRDMRPSNILVTHEFEPMLGDFGLAKMQRNDIEKLSEKKVVGMVGYLAPEYAERGRVSTKTDVYSFGVVLLELITGQTALERNHQEKSLVGWARPLLRDRIYPELIDERILESHDVHQLYWMVSVAERCLCSDPEKRPSMEKVESALKCIINKEAVWSIDDFSPAHSSFCSVSQSNESQGDAETETAESTNESLTTSSSRSQTRQAYRLAYLPQTSRPLIPGKLFEGLLFGKREASADRRVRIHSTPRISYDEMLDF
ncbi:inactive protein kinase SELMODRAFT_444075-like [Ananas comosus]|uniref:Inactive protein kinase SELMODRAFT_444075-like n=1 Tax=Ananas comosus TaxID=4615 RepID=A0A6P5GIW1_ANACO|nr:inactive protein kinase SELMODRAFT_444075-like [Ananas comosus]